MNRLMETIDAAVYSRRGCIHFNQCHVINSRGNKRFTLPHHERSQKSLNN